MREVKYNKEESDDDIFYAFSNNNLGYLIDEIDSIIAEVCGANDELDWYWVLKMKDDSFMSAQGGCDYTGWDCQSNCSVSERYLDVESCLEDLECEEISRPNIKETLLAQVKGEQPFALYEYK